VHGTVREIVFTAERSRRLSRAVELSEMQG
jgi:hypothetical protein